MPEHHYVSPTIAIDDWNSGRKTDVDVFEDQLSGWIFAPARVLHPNQHNGTALLLLLTPYFEMIASFLRGTESKGKSTRYLRYGLRRVLPDATRASIEAYINQVRHGVMHEAIFRRVVLHKGQHLPAFGFVRAGPHSTLVVDPFALLGRVEAHFTDYVRRLRDPSEKVLRRRFDKFWQAKQARR